MKRLLILEDHAAFRQALAHLLEWCVGFRESVEAGSLAEARKLLRNVKFDAAIVDLDLPDGDGMEIVREIRYRNPGVALLTFSHGNPAHHAAATSMGKDQSLSKETPIADILAAARRLAE